MVIFSSTSYFKMDYNPEQIERLYRNCVNLYSYRSLQKPQEKEIDFSSISENSFDTLNMFQDGLAILFYIKVSISTLASAAALASSNSCTSLVIITSICQMAQKSLEKNNITITILSVSDMLQDIFEHYLVPKQRLLSIEEKETIMDRMHVTIEQMAKMRMDDPVSLRLGAKRGDIMEIERGDHDEIFYRAVM